MSDAPMHGPKEASLQDVGRLTDLSPESMGMVGDILLASARSSASVQQRIDEAKDRQIRDLAQTIVDLDAILAQALVIDRTTEARLRMMEGRIWTAADTLDRMQSSL